MRNIIFPVILLTFVILSVNNILNLRKGKFNGVSFLFKRHLNDITKPVITKTLIVMFYVLATVNAAIIPLVLFSNFSMEWMLISSVTLNILIVTFGYYSITKRIEI